MPRGRLWEPWEDDLIRKAAAENRERGLRTDEGRKLGQGQVSAGALREPLAGRGGEDRQNFLRREPAGESEGVPFPTVSRPSSHRSSGAQ